MTYRTGNPTLRNVVGEIGRRDYPGQQPAIENNGRAVRLSKGKDATGNASYEVRTRPAGRGLEWNFARRIAQESALVSLVEKEIDSQLGQKGMGRKLTKSVGAYDKFLNPRLDAEQLAKLQNRVDQMQRAGSPPPGLKAAFDADDTLMWVGRIVLSGKPLRQMKANLKEEFTKSFIKTNATGAVVAGEQFERDRTRSHMVFDEHYQKTDLRYRSPEQASRFLRDYMGDDVAASNVTAMMSQTTIACFDVPCTLQTKYLTGDQSELENGHPNANKLSFAAKRDDQDHLFSFKSHRALNAISHDGGPQALLDGEKSSCRISFGLKISQNDLADGVADTVRLVGKPVVEYRLYPKLPEVADA